MMVSQNKMSFAQISDTAPKAQLIDVHHHFVSSTYKADASARGVAVPGSDWTPEMSLAEMNKSGVAMAMLSQPGQLSGDVQAIRKLARERMNLGHGWFVIIQVVSGYLRPFRCQMWKEALRKSNTPSIP
jgi:predicted TIM-barrel fold metal-dependent hydrolase